MLKDKTIRTRIDPRLRERIAEFIKSEARRGRSIDLSTIVRDAVVEFLDREQRRHELNPPSREAQLNERPSSRVDEVAEAAAKRAIENLKK